MVRVLLAALLIHPRTLRTADQLIDDLWAERAPVTARTSLHNLVSSLRRTVGRELLETSGNGYVLVVDVDQVDASRFERLIEIARGECLGEKVRLLDAALESDTVAPAASARRRSSSTVGGSRAAAMLRPCDSCAAVMCSWSGAADTGSPRLWPRAMRSSRPS